MRQGQPPNRQRSRNRNQNNRGSNNNNQNNNRNNLNRSLESNGPDVRIRGTAAHIAEKYMQLANDAQTSGDTVMAQSYWQYAEHYNRVIAIAQAAQAEQQAERQAKDQARENRDNERDQNRNRDQDQRRNNDERGGTDDSDKNEAPNVRNRDDAGRNDEQGDTNERKPRRPRRSRNEDSDDTSVGSHADAQSGGNASKDDGADDKPTGDDVKPRKRTRRAPTADGDDAKADAPKADAPKAQANGDDQEKPVRTRRPRKKTDGPVAEDAAELPAFVTGE